MDLKYILKIALRKKSLIITVVSISLIAAYFLTKNMKQVYISESIIASGLTDDSQIEIEDKEKKESEIRQQFSNLVELARSKKIIDQVSYRLMLHDLQDASTFNNQSTLFKDLTKDARMSAVEVLKQKTDSLTALNFHDKNQRGIIDLIKSMGYDYEAIFSSLKVKRIDNSDFISVVFESSNSEMSAFVVNQLTAALIVYYRNNSRNKNVELVNFWEQLSEEKKMELDEKVNQLKDYKIKNQIINLYEQTKSIDNQIAAMEMKREDVNKNITGYRNAIENIHSKLSSDDRKYAEFDLEPFSKSITEKKDEINSLNEKLSVYHYDNPELQNELARKKSELNTMVLQLSDANTFSPNAVKQDLIAKKLGLEIENEIAEANVNSIDREISRLRNKFNSFTPLEGTIQAYEREVDVSSKVYIETLSKLNNQSMKSNIEAKLEQTQAGMPGQMLPSKKGMIILLAGVLSLVLTLVAIFLTEYFSHHLNNAKKFTGITKLELIGSIDKLSKIKFSLNEIFGINTGNAEIENLKNNLRNIKFDVLNRIPANSSLLICSPGSKTGKSLISASLAFMLAYSGKKVLLVDGSLNNNSISRSFGFVYPADQNVYSEANIKTVAKGLDFLGNRGVVDDIDRVDNSRLSELITELKKRYDFLIVDSDSQVFPTFIKPFSDTSDYMIGIFRSDKALTEKEKDDLIHIKDFGSKYIGSILNFIEDSSKPEKTSSNRKGDWIDTLTSKLKQVYCGTKEVSFSGNYIRNI